MESVSSSLGIWHKPWTHAIFLGCILQRCPTRLLSGIYSFSCGLIGWMPLVLLGDASKCVRLGLVSPIAFFYYWFKVVSVDANTGGSFAMGESRVDGHWVFIIGLHTLCDDWRISKLCRSAYLFKCEHFKVHFVEAWVILLYIVWLLCSTGLLISFLTLLDGAVLYLLANDLILTLSVLIYVFLHLWMVLGFIAPIKVLTASSIDLLFHAEIH